MRNGYIYVITNKINGKQYVGQTSRDIDTRFAEHWGDKRSNSAIHLAIQKYGVQNFKVEELECIPLNKLDEREKYWIAKLDTYTNGYNKNSGGNQSFGAYNQVIVVEKDYIFDSKEDMARQISNLTDWSFLYLKSKISEVINTEKTFFGYHLKSLKANQENYVDIVDFENWVKTLNIQYQGQHIYCQELDKEFDTVGEAAKFLVDNGYYKGNSLTPIQSLVTAIGYNINGKTETANNMTFYKVPGTTKNKGSNEPFISKKIYCPQIDKSFNSQTEAAQYFINNKIWTGIKLKTAKLRISDIVRGVFPHYRNYTFSEID